MNINDLKVFRMDGEILALGFQQPGAAISLRCPELTLNGVTYGAGLTAMAVDGCMRNEELTEITFAPIRISGRASLEISLFIKWYSVENVLRKWCVFKITGESAPLLLEELVLDRIVVPVGASIVHIQAKPQSSPVFCDGFYAGIEFPIAATRIENGTVVLAQRAGYTVEPGVRYESKTAVYGITPKGREKEAFTRYISSKAYRPADFHVNYNSWWTSPVPYSENDILGLMDVFKGNLYEKNGETFDSFCIDMGWSDPHSVWKVDETLFPESFENVAKAAGSMQAGLGLWVSPSACYPRALDNDWAREQGYEASSIPRAGGRPQRYACLAGRKYQRDFKESILDLVRRFDIKHIKLDGYIAECGENDHGHIAGDLSSESIAEGMIDILQALKNEKPGIWLEATCFGWNPSPWWLLYVTSLLGNHGDDAPYGRVPCPVLRESYTSARDYFNLQGAGLSPVPVRNQEVLGIVHQTGDSFVNDALMTVMRGHMFLPVYINPAYMDEKRWKSFAAVIRWARANAGVLNGISRPLLPVSWQGGNIPVFTNDEKMPREPYGYSHWTGGSSGLIALRNPWIEPSVYSFALPESGDAFNISGIYPELRSYGENIKGGESVTIPLRPYETVILSVSPEKGAYAEPPAPDEHNGYLKVRHAESKAADSGIAISSKVTVGACDAELLILLESGSQMTVPEYSVTIDGKTAEIAISGTHSNWAHSSIPRTENWMFLAAQIPEGEHEISFDIKPQSADAEVSAWVWATKPGDICGLADAAGLPQPDIISIDSVCLCKSTKLDIFVK